MKTFYSIMIIFLIFWQTTIILSSDSLNKPIVKTSKVEDIEKKIFMRPFYNFVFGIRGGYNIVFGKYEKFFDHSPMGIVYFVLNPKLIDNFLGELEIGYNKAFVKNDNKSYLKNLNAIINAKYQMSLFSSLNIYGLVGGGVNDTIAHFEHSYNKDINVIGSLWKIGIGIDYAYDYNYILDLRSDYRLILNNKNDYQQGLGAYFSVGFAFGANPGMQFGKYIDCKHNLKEIFPARANNYSKNGLDKIKIKNNLKRTITRLSVSLKNSDYIKSVDTSEEFKNIQPQGLVNIPLKIFLNDNSQKITDDKSDEFVINIDYNVDGIPENLKMKIPITMNIYRSHGVTWDNTKKIGSFITINDKVVESFIRDAIVSLKAIEQEDKYYIPVKNINKAIQVYSALTAYGLKYVSDPNGIKVAGSNKMYIDTIQYPREFLKSHTGDCDDFSILFCTMLENIGVPSAVITVPGHIYTAFDSGYSVKELEKIMANKFVKGNQDGIIFSYNAFINYEGHAWIPVETTFINSNETFFNSWKRGIVQYKRAKGIVQLVPTSDSISEYYPNGLPDSKDSFKTNKATIGSIFIKNISELRNWVIKGINKSKKDKKSLSEAWKVNMPKKD